MKVSTRDVLADLLIESLSDPMVAAAVHCLAQYCESLPSTPSALSLNRFLAPVPAENREDVLRILQHTPLLSWDIVDQVTLAPAFASEYAEITAKLKQYDAALAVWEHDRKAPETTALTTALRQGVLLFNYQLFFEVHEVLEARWVKETGEVRRFLQGLIQIAVAFHHVGNRNLRGALALLQDGLEKIAPHQPAFLGIELCDFIAAVESCREELLRLGAERLALFQVGMIPQMHVTEPPFSA